MWLNWLTFAAFLWVVIRLSGRRPALPRLVVDTLRVRKPAGHDAFVSGSDSGSEDGSDPDDDGREVASGALVVSGQGVRVSVVDDPPPPGLIERMTSRLERWADRDLPEVVHETTDPAPTSREVGRDELYEHLRRERARDLPATLIVRSAANQDGVPWGRVPERTVWRVWAKVCQGDAS